MPLNRALSKLGILSRAQAAIAVRDGRVRVDGSVVRDPSTPIVPERARIEVDGRAHAKAGWRTILLNKPRGVVTTRHDPQGRPTIYDALTPRLEDDRGLMPVGRLDLATSGLLLLTTDTQLANWLTDPENDVPRVYTVTVRGRVDDEARARLAAGVTDRGERLQAASVQVRKASGRESHLVVELREGRNRELRRLFGAVGFEVTRLARVRVGRLELGTLRHGAWREISVDEIRAAFPGVRLRS